MCYHIEINYGNRKGGGVCVCKRNSVDHALCYDFEKESLTTIIFEIRKPNSKPFLICTWYCPSHSPTVI